MNVREEIVQSMARAFFVHAYADFMESPYQSGPPEYSPEANERDRHDAERSGLPKPGPGEDWMDHSPETSPAAWAEAWTLAKKIEAQTGKDLYALFIETKIQCGESGSVGGCPRRLHTPDQFGHCLAMEAMGTGCAWSDDHADLTWEVPYSGEAFLILSRAEALAGETEAA